MDLTDPRPRWVSVRFEVSPPEQPGRLDVSYGESIRARFDPTDDPRRIRVTIAGRDVERSLFAGQSPVANSFSDFVWVFDTSSGAVVSAELSGAVVHRLGFLEQEVGLDVRLTTRQPAGHLRPRQVLGRLVFDYCPGSDAERNAASGCSIVRTQRYDAVTGYVNAVGSIEARVAGMTQRSFAPLGEAVFHELAGGHDTRRVARLPAP